tara:strand:- start:309 stop:557 length:249 start_codon:yes stop_codon:yes gene_type:complete
LVPLIFLAGSVLAIELISLSYLLLGQWLEKQVEKLFGWKSLLSVAGSTHLLAPAPPVTRAAATKRHPCGRGWVRAEKLTFTQ